TIVDKHRATASRRDAVSAGQMEAESRAEFEELLLQYRQTTQATKAVEHSKQTLEQELQEIRFELDPEKVRGEDPPPGSGRSKPLGGFEEFVRELDKQVVQVFEIRRVILGRSESPEAVAELGRVEEILRASLSKLIQVERERFAASSGDAREISILRNRMAKLQAHIATMETSLKTLSTAKTFSNQQVQNLLRELGLAEEDKNFEKKR